MTARKIITFDYGASSGRAILGAFDGDRLEVDFGGGVDTEDVHAAHVLHTP